MTGSDFAQRLAAIDDCRILRQAIEVVPGAVFWKDADGHFCGGNRRFLDIVGVDSVDDILGRGDDDFFTIATAEACRSADRHVMDTGDAMVDVEESFTGLDGAAEVFHTSRAPLRDDAGDVVGVVGGFRRVTTTGETASALLRSEERYELVAEASRDGIWDWDGATDSIELSPRCAELLGLPPSVGNLPAPEVVALFGPEQAAEFGRAAAEVFATAEGPFSATARLEREDASPRWVQVVGAPLVRDGLVERIVGSLADITDDIESRRDLRHRASHDSLTGLKNRWSLSRRTEQVLGSGRLASLLYLDLDQFKVVNDSLGHHVGDEMLASVARRLRAVAGSESTTLARVGGDEFAVLCDGLDPASCEELAAVLVQELAVPFEISGLEMYTSVSIGVVHVAPGHRTSADVLRDADTCMYRAKAAGKSCYRVFESEMRAEADTALLHQNGIRRAVETMQFSLSYQPICDASNGAMVGVEALIRWPRGDGEHLEPSAFLPFLEQTGLIVQVGEWVIDRACRQLAEWRAADPRAERLYIAVNLSRIQFRSEVLVDVIIQAMADASVSPGDLVIELTETAVSGDPDAVSTQLLRLQALGVRIAIDDFGVGQSSLSLLDRLPVDILKLDRMLVTELRGVEPAPVTSGVIAMAHALGLVTIAEGIELSGQWAWLQRAQCDLMQGYLFGRPMAPEAVLDHLG